MSTPSSPPPPDPPNLSRHGKWGVAPSTSPQMTRSPRKFKAGTWLWWLLAAVLVIVVVLVLVSLA